MLADRYVFLISHLSISFDAYNMSITANTTYMASFPKRPDITGAPNQVFQFNNFLERLIGGIKANTISAIGTINPGSLCTQYLYAPQIHFNMVWEPIAFIGNSSNKIGKFSLIKIDVTYIILFPYIKDKATMDVSLNHGDDLPKELLSKTNWNDFKEPIIGTLIPDFFITYFGQDLPMATSVTMKSRQNLFVWALDMNYGPTLPTMPSRNWMTSLVSWRKSKLQNPSRSTSTQIGMLSPSLWPHQTAPLVQRPQSNWMIIRSQPVLSRTYSNLVLRQLL